MGTYRIALLGGVPPVLGGGGLERQLDETAAALTRRGHLVKRVHELRADERFDVLHVIGNGSDNWQNLQHWRKHLSPMVVSPVIVCAPGNIERKLRIGARLGVIPNVNSMTRDILLRADHVIALTEYERQLVGKLAGRSVPVTVIGNGVSRSTPAATNPVATDRPYVAMLGSISARKRQPEVLKKLGDRFHFGVVGGVEGGESERRSWAELVDSRDAVWPGEEHDPATVARFLTDAGALLLFSRAEVQSLAVLEALAYSTPVVASDHPSHRELSEHWPGWVFPVKSIEAAAAPLAELLANPPSGPAPEVMTWDSVAEAIESVYELVLGGSPADSTRS